MFLATDPARPILLFVGRPLDPNKGLVTFLDALDLLLTLPLQPLFVVWLIGGDDDELCHLHALISHRPRLQHEAKEGRFLIWGKVKRDALPEFYRRSLVVVMPSFREQFGLVAIEAMACGAPVVGTMQGGISDTVLAGLTGATVEIDQPDALAGALLLYLRGPALRNTRGRLAREWASKSFAKANTYGRMADLYTDKALPQLAVVDWDLRQKFHAAEVSKRLNCVEEIIGRPIDKWRIVADRYHVVARIDTPEGPLALKVFRDRPSLSAAIFPIGAMFPARTAQDLVDNALYHAKNPRVPSLIATHRDSGVAVYAWVEGKPLQITPAALRVVAEDFAAYGTFQKDHKSQADTYLFALGQFLADRDEHTLGKLDFASAALNRIGQQANIGVRLSHPVAELTRIAFCLDKQGWPIPVDVGDRMRMVVNLLLAKVVPFDELPRLRHGDLKQRHLISVESGPMVIDTEHSVFAVGELDLGAYAAGEVTRGVSMFNVVRYISHAADSPALATTAFQWMTYFLIYGYLTRVHHGRTSDPAKVIRRALSDLALAIA